MFNIEILEGAAVKGQLLLNEATKQPFAWDRGDAAQEEVKQRNDAAKLQGLAIRYKVKRADLPTSELDRKWEAREKARFDNGTYKLVPWASEEWFIASSAAKKHYLHVSTERPGFIAYTPNEQMGQMDRQEQMTAGRYLTKHFGKHLTADQIRTYAGRVYATSAQYKLCFAATPEEIEAVYRIGPKSCMTTMSVRSDDGNMPVFVYGAGDLQIAYLAKSGQAMARAVCWPAKKVYGRVYPEDMGAAQQELRQRLDNLGWKHFSRDTFKMYDGARLLRAPLDIDRTCFKGMGNRAFLVPYLDHGLSVRDHGDHLTISIEGFFARDGGHGIAYGYECGCKAVTHKHAKSYRDWRGFSPTDDGKHSKVELVCPSCIPKTKCCPTCEMHFPPDMKLAETDKGKAICKRCIQGMGYEKCSDCARYSTACRTIKGKASSRRICDGCAAKKESGYSYCERCYVHFEKDAREDFEKTCVMCLPVQPVVIETVPLQYTGTSTSGWTIYNTTSAIHEEERDGNF